MKPLWTSDEILAATGGTLAGAPFEVSGVTFDSREIVGGELFVAMPGTAHDGHDFVSTAFERGATAALVSQAVDGPHVLVEDVAKALTDLALAARARMAGTVIGVTGSVGKTSTKEALHAALERWRPGAVHKSVKSYNNHTGVPLSLARMPQDSFFAVLEMGMNHAGEIAALTRLVRPHVALITAVAAAHIENLGSIEAIADAKAEIFEGLEPDGVAILPEASEQRDRLVKAARRFADRTVTTGGAEGDVHVLHSAPASTGGTLVTACLMDSELTFTIAQPGDHWVQNALAVLAAVEAVGADVAVAGLALADLAGMKGRGQRHHVAVAGGEALLIDESYNANPASVAATLKSLGDEKGVNRRLAVLGPMRELGEQSDALHAGLAGPVTDAGVDELVLLGEETRPLEEALAGRLTVHRAADVAAASALVLGRLRAGDALLVKASNSVGLAKLVDAVTGKSA